MNTVTVSDVPDLIQRDTWAVHQLYENAMYRPIIIIGFGGQVSLKMLFSGYDLI